MFAFLGSFCKYLVHCLGQRRQILALGYNELQVAAMNNGDCHAGVYLACTAHAVPGISLFETYSETRLASLCAFVLCMLWVCDEGYYFN